MVVPTQTRPDLRDKIAVVTGSSRGIGKGIAEALGEAGATVYVTGRTEDDATSTVPLPGTIHATAQAVTELGGVGIALRCDHSCDADIEALFSHVQREHGRLDILVNNAWAGYQAMQRGEPGFQTKFWKLPPQFWDTMFTVGVRAHYVASVYAARLRRSARLSHGCWRRLVPSMMRSPGSPTSKLLRTSPPPTHCSLTEYR